MLKQIKNSNTTTKLAVLSIILSGASLALTVARLCKKSKCGCIGDNEEFDCLDGDEDDCDVSDLPEEEEEDDFSFHENADDAELEVLYRKVK